MLDALLAAGPHSDLAEELSLFAPLIGAWDLEVHFIEPDGTVRTVPGEWEFGWALNGRAVLDVWICPPRAEQLAGADGEWGMSVRFYDPALDAWRSTWHGPSRGWVIPFRGTRTPDGIDLTGERDGVTLRWTFANVTADAFTWQAEETPQGGRPVIRQRFRAVRKPG